ncbi:bifunctional indole-3-glycerol-phosphate synthase TrpC/phosphoribosylanthranilate isomerase TrpF [Aliidiomarina iranensis]|uniref:Multifunctional fusion protein n=1 Tax=Aliidiomarina iranensis TaxID=1434071 RepID=A0A432VSH9_9GAMM|nr:bifunctional indole-3-glycerol-phosphate synthase TrpC/phosphoribosylanthranilate isomerase TrpF [Aliidiomarina iranensis]RUO19286.1 bifunctional indole-3-glycerol-phosphate synthase TrpC/phosphoribosylanthranilate isomerase TrpF [Aliidiomarina iranensis]
MSFVVHSDTPTVLQEIVAKRQQRLAAMREHYPEAEIAASALASSRPVRDFTAALAEPGAQFILECKKASPSKGLIRENFDPVAIARVYGSYAAAISVLTEPDYFQGDFAYLQAVSAQVNTPVLCKDFIVSTYQVDLARYFGADAILLMLSVLSDDEYRALAARAEQLGLHILTEVSDAEEMHRAAALEARVIGVNHRNLRDLSVDLNRSQELAALAPKNALLIAESGIENNRQVRSISPHVDGFLVGGALTAQDDVDMACRALIYGEHKVCGITSEAQAIAARSAGAVYAGLIFAKRSPRAVTQTQAKQICQTSGLQFVGVFSLDDYPHATEHDTTETAEAIAKLAIDLDLAAVQLHDVTENQVITKLAALLQVQAQSQVHSSSRVKARGKDNLVTGNSKTANSATENQHKVIEIWQAHSVKPEESAINTAPFTPEVARILFDHGRGGSGQTFDWQLLPATPEQRQHIQLAGGLNRENIAKAAAQGCRGLDINSGLERQPGHKDPAWLQQAFRAIRLY